MKPSVDPTGSALTFLKNVPLFAGLGETALGMLAQSSTFMKVEKGQFIFFQSDPAKMVYLVRSGQISIILESPDGREMVINEMHPGDLFGEVGVLTRQPRSTSAIAHTKAELLAFPHQTFLGTLDSEPTLARRILDITASRLRSSSERESALVFLDAQARLARLLLQLEKQALRKGYVTISQEELARRTGQTRQTVAKALGRWRRAGWIITGRGHIMLLRHDAFEQLEKEWLK